MSIDPPTNPIAFEPSNRIGFEPAAGTLYDALGGMERFLKLSAAFYSRVETDPILRPMYPKELEGAEENLALFIAQFFGGPTSYSEKRGHPRLRLRHNRFSIDQAARDVWMRHMTAAMDEVGIVEPARTSMLHYFEQTATFLINRAEEES